MSLLNRLKHRLDHWLRTTGETDPEQAYDLWSASYDDQPDNLVLALDDELFSGLLNDLAASGKIIVDIGCGTGRNWPKMMNKNVQRLIGYDVSAGMLNVLREKYPLAETYQLKSSLLPELQDQSCDIIVSTLAIAHIPDLQKALQEWDRVLKPGGDVVITDYHPEALSRGGKRTFTFQNRSVTVNSYIYPVEQVIEWTKQLGWRAIRSADRKIGEAVRHYYEKKQALKVYERFKGVPMVYGIHLKKADAAS